MLINAHQAALLVIDVQEKLVPYIAQQEEMIANCHWLMAFAQEVNIPILLSEHYAKGLGTTVPLLCEMVSEQHIMQKVHFSCAAEQVCMERMDSVEKQQFIIMGIETHVCVLQTAIPLVEQGKEVFVVADAVSSRDRHDHQLGLQRMRDAGVNIVSKEMVFFESLIKAGTDQFRQLSKRFMKG